MMARMDTDRDGRTAVHRAAASGDAERVRTLVEEGHDVDGPDRTHFTPLHFAAQEQHADAAQALVGLGADIEARNVYGATPLLVALTNGRDRPGEVVRVLLAAGADPDASNKTGVSPRSLSARVSNFDLGRFFRTDALS